MAGIDDIEIPSLLFDQQSSDPSTPGSDLWRLYFKSGGLYAIDDAGTVVGPFAAAGGGALQADKVVRTAGDLTTSSTSFVDATGMSITMTTGANRVLIGVIAIGAVNTNQEYIELTIDVDGTPQGGTRGLTRARFSTAAQDNRNLSFTYLTDTLTAASHTFKLQWKVVNGNTGTLFATSAAQPLTMWAVEQAV